MRACHLLLLVLKYLIHEKKFMIYISYTGEVLTFYSLHLLSAMRMTGINLNNSTINKRLNKCVQERET